MVHGSDAGFGLHRNRANGSISGRNLVFSLKKYLEHVHREENVYATVVATYRLSLPAIIKEYPILFDDSKPINLLLLHGEKGEGKNIVLSEARKELLHSKHNRSLEIWEVLPQLSSPTSKKIVHAKGVHHPKYMLVFSDRGLHVVLSTANFNGSECTDGVWHGFFPFLQKNLANIVDSDNDFGIVLQDFIERQSEQLSREEELSTSCFSPRCIIDWIEKYAGVRSLRDQFDFTSASNIKLVSTVPSRQPLPELSPKEEHFLRSQSSFDMDMQRLVPCELCMHERVLLDKDDHFPYGSRRVKQLLRKGNFTSSNNSFGKLLIQQTSIGLSINNSFMDMFLQDLMPETNWEENSPSTYGRREDNYEIIWPTLIHMNNIQRYYRLNPPSYRRLTNEEPLSQISSISYTLTQETLIKDDSLSLRRTQESDFQEEDSDEEDAVKEERERRRGILFFQPSFYATMEPDIHSQFHTYESWPQAKGLFAPCRYLVPHIKTYCRLFNPPTSHSFSDIHLNSSEKKRYRQISFQSTPTCDNFQDNPPEPSASFARHNDDNCTCPQLAWLLLTSACLSRGAQGRIVPFSVCDCCGHIRRGYYEYRNFELGVLFQSSLDRQYVALSPTCAMHQTLFCHSSTISTSIAPSSPTKSLDSQAKAANKKLYIPLPLPYQVQGSRPYCDARQSLMVCPYFHQPSEIRKYISEFRNRDPLFCSYPSSSTTNNSKTNVLSTLHSLPSLPFSGRKRRFSRTDDDDIHIVNDGSCSSLARAETISGSITAVGRRRQFVLPPSHSSTTQATSNASKTWKRAVTTPALNFLFQNTENIDSHNTDPFSDELEDMKTGKKHNISPHKPPKSQRAASYSPDKFSTSELQLFSLSQTEEMLHFQHEMSIAEAKENNNENDPVLVDFFNEDPKYAFVLQSVFQEKEEDVYYSLQQTHLHAFEDSHSNMQSKAKIEISNTMSRVSSSKIIIENSAKRDEEESKFSLQQEVSESGEIVYKLVRY